MDRGGVPFRLGKASYLVFRGKKWKIVLVLIIGDER